jgi:hypothetical protein
MKNRLQRRAFSATDIDAGATITRDYFKCLQHFKKAVGEHWTMQAGLIYGGEEIQRRSEASVNGALQSDELFERRAL